MHAKRKWTALLCAVALLITLSPPQARAADEYLFIAINENLIPRLSGDTMPISYYGNYYVPYVLFDQSYMSANYGISVDTGIYATATGNTVLLYSKRRQLTYDLDAGTCTDRDGNSYSGAVSIGGVTYLPISSVSSYFREDGLSFRTLSTAYGPILRLTTPSVVLDDATFAGTAASQLPRMIRDYTQGQEPAPSPAPSTPSTPPPSPAPGPSEGKSDVRVSFSFRCGGGENTARLLDTLDTLNLPALLFFSPDELVENEALVRRAVGKGHALGLVLSGSGADSAKAQLTEGNRLLSLIAHTSTRTLLLENPDSTTVILLDADGWSVWNDNVPVSPEGKTAAEYSAAIASIVGMKNAVGRITMGDTVKDRAALSLLVPALRRDKYSIRLAVGSEVA